ncbi:facilitated trehalose transporter Tret1-like [Oratosquilla oratoria]|uniref:facilitated trehalose transporter Tret1-like n=1 Tax=Oratosquilla oratoria TaxID=337810 RepID=UPI003F75F8FE
MTPLGSCVSVPVRGTVSCRSTSSAILGKYLCLRNLYVYQIHSSTQDQVDMISEKPISQKKSMRFLRQIPKQSTRKLEPYDESNYNAPISETSSKQEARVFPQVWASLVVAISQMATGSVISWSGTALPSLIADPSITLDTLGISLVVSCNTAGCLIATIVAGRALDYFGRLRTLRMVAPLLISGWITIAQASNAYIVYVGRFICGFATGFIFTGAQVYSSETPEARLRGRLGSIPSLFTTVGTLYAYGTGAALSWRIGCYVCAAIPIILILFSTTIPESPYWLLLKGQHDEAEASLTWLRGPEYDIGPEVQEMQAKIDSVGNKAKISELWKARTRSPFLIALLMQTLQQTCGANIVMMYTGIIFMNAKTGMDPQVATAITGVAQLVSNIISMILIDKIGRKILIITSISVTSTCVFILATFFYLRDVQEIRWPGWVPLFLVITAVFGYCIGARSVPWLLSAELFNTTIRTTASSFCTFYNRGLNLIIVQVFPFLEEVAGTYTPFYIMSAISIAGVIVTVIFVPETKGKSLAEIQEYFETRVAKRRRPSVEA